ncbi:hypothetical protein V6N13_126848 [Hibiscus sabdariffa]
MATQIWSRFRAFGAFVGCNQPKNENEEIEKKHWTTSVTGEARRSDDGLVSFLTTFIYASPNLSQCSDIWFHLRSLANTAAEPWALIGDFNVTLLNQDRKGCSSSSPDTAFQNMVFDCGLQDLNYVGSEFTWYRDNCGVRIDRCFGNSMWFENFLTAILHHLLRMKSNHRPLLLSPTSASTSLRTLLFRYFSGWSQHKDFSYMITDNWDSSQPLYDAIQTFTLTASNWNHDVFGSIGRNKRNLMARLRVVQLCLDQKRIRSLLKFEQKLLNELETLLDHEEQLWQQKTMMDWIHFGDRNTCYFHSKAIPRRRRTTIFVLKIGSGEWCDDSAQLRSAATAYFSSLFAVGDSSPVSYPISGYFPTIDEAVSSSLCSIPLD